MSVDEAIHIAKLRSDDTGTIRHMAGSNLLQCLQISVEEYIQELIHKELQSYAKVDNCMMKKSSARDMESFNLQVYLGVFILQVIYRPCCHAFV